jgi:hypothetical protein
MLRIATVCVPVVKLSESHGCLPRSMPKRIAVHAQQLGLRG